MININKICQPNNAHIVENHSFTLCTIMYAADSLVGVLLLLASLIAVILSL